MECEARRCSRACAYKVDDDGVEGPPEPLPPGGVHGGRPRHSGRCRHWTDSDTGQTATATATATGHAYCSRNRSAAAVRNAERSGRQRAKASSGWLLAITRASARRRRRRQSLPVAVICGGSAFSGGSKIERQDVLLFGARRCGGGPGPGPVSARQSVIPSQALRAPPARTPGIAPWSTQPATPRAAANTFVINSAARPPRCAQDCPSLPPSPGLVSSPRRYEPPAEHEVPPAATRPASADACPPCLASCCRLYHTPWHPPSVHATRPRTSWPPSCPY